MKKLTLSMVAVATMGAISMSAAAADVTLYGRIDYGMVYNNDSVTDFDGVKTDSDTLSMDSGVSTGSRFGLKGNEDLGNGLTIGFVLENGFKSDTGALGTASTLFDREASLSVSGGFGKVIAGRFATFMSDAGSMGWYGAMASSFGTGWSSNITGHTAVMANYASRNDNSIGYETPDFGGFKAYAMYAMGANGSENKAGTDRYAAIGAKYTVGGFNFGVVFDWLNKDSTQRTYGGMDANTDDTYTFNVAGSYDCGFATTYLALQYFDGARDAGSVIAGTGFYDTAIAGEDGVAFAKSAFALNGYAAHLSTKFSALGGTFMAGIGYMDGDVDFATRGDIGDVNAYTASLGYTYQLSKRTRLYTGAGYVKREADFVNTATDKASWEQESFDVVAGIAHYF